MTDMSISEIEDDLLMRLSDRPMTYPEIEAVYGLAPGKGVDLALLVSQRGGVSLDITGNGKERRIGLSEASP